MAKTKKFILLCFLALFAAVFAGSRGSVSQAEGDPIIQEITEYKNWTRINKSPILVASTDGQHTSQDGSRAFNVNILDGGG